MSHKEEIYNKQPKFIQNIVTLTSIDRYMYIVTSGHDDFVLNLLTVCKEMREKSKVKT